MKTAIDVQVAGIDFDDDAHMAAIGSSLLDCGFAKINGITIMTVFSDQHPLDDTIAAICKLELIPGARAVRVYLDLVNTAQIAHRVGLTRKSIRNWSHQSGFPEPAAVVGNSNVWVWHEVETWLMNRKGYGYLSPLRPPTKQAVADINMYIASRCELDEIAESL